MNHQYPAGRLILIVDDSSVNRIILRKILTGLEQKVIEAESGEQAISFCQEHQFDLIFMDIEMPSMTGIEAAASIRQSTVTHCPIVAVSGHNSEDAHQQSRQAGMNGYITKPINADEIERMLIRQLL